MLPHSDINPPNLLGKIKNKSKNSLSRVLQKQMADLSGSETVNGGLLNSSSWLEPWCTACAGPSSVLHLSPLLTCPLFHERQSISPLAYFPFHQTLLTPCTLEV